MEMSLDNTSNQLCVGTRVINAFQIDRNRLTNQKRVLKRRSQLANGKNRRPRPFVE